jgi:nucleoside-diphosphate-sugar epimerase
VFYCAGLTADYVLRPADTVEAHVGLLSRILSQGGFEALVYLSSTRLYDGQPTSRGGTEEGSFIVDAGNTRSLYDLSKMLGENLCRVMGLGKARVARLACVYRDETDADGFLPGLLRQVLAASRGGTFSVDSSPSLERDYVHVDDVVDALIKIAVAGRYDVYNVASGENVTNARLAQEIEAFTGVRLRFDRSDHPAPAAGIDRSRLTEELGWNPRALGDAIREWANCRGF